MSKSRLEAFSDGVIAIIITIMVLELEIPHGTSWTDLRPVLPTFSSYVLSFVIIGIYWNNHHHMLHAAHHVNGRIMWANQHLLFWLSVVPFVTGWMGEMGVAFVPITLYGVVLLMASIAYYILARTLIAHHGADSALARAIGRDRKGLASTLLYVIALPLGLVSPHIPLAIFILVAIIWLVPDRRFERLQVPS